MEILLSLIFIAALGFLLYCLFKLLIEPRLRSKQTQDDLFKSSSQPASNSREARRYGDQGNQVEYRINNMEKQIAELKNEVSELGKLVGKLRENMSKSPQEPINNSAQSMTGDSIGNPRQPFTRKEKYVDKLDPNGIEVYDLKDANSNYALLVITIVEPTKAEFKVNDLSGAQRSLLSSYQYSLPNYVNVTVMSPSPTRIKTIKPGKLTLNGNRWMLAEKANAEIV